MTTNHANIVDKYVRPKSGNWHDYVLLMRMNRPIGSLLLLWPTLWALLLASEGQPSVANLLIFTLGVFVMRSAGCVINDYADRHIDGNVKRTRERPLAARRLSEANALTLFGALLLLALVLVLATNWLTILLSLVAVALASVYPFAKRRSHLAQVVLGAAFSWAIPMAFAAETGELPMTVWLVYTVNLLWVVAYDTFYAMVDRDDDLKIGVKSTAILFAENDRVVTAALQGMVILGLLLMSHHFNLGIIYHVSVAAAAGLFVHQQRLIRFRQRQACFEAFLNSQWVGFVVFMGIALDYLIF